MWNATLKFSFNIISQLELCINKLFNFAQLVSQITTFLLPFRFNFNTRILIQFQIINISLRT